MTMPQRDPGDDPDDSLPSEEIFGDRIRAQQRQHRRVRRVLGGLASLGVLAGALAMGPGWMIRHARVVSGTCETRVEHDAAGDPHACAAAARRWLALPAVLPWSRAEARKAERDAASLAAFNALRLSTTAAPDGAARDRAAEEYLALHAGDPQHSGTSLDVLSQFGATPVVLRHAAQQTTVAAQQDFMRAALLRGQPEAVRTLPDLPELTPFKAQSDLARGALLCLFGERAHGMAVQGGITESMYEPFLAISAAACGAESREPRSYLAEARVLLAMAPPLPVYEGRPNLDALGSMYSVEKAGPALLAYTIAAQPLPPRALLSLLAPPHGAVGWRLDAREFSSPWALLSEHWLLAGVRLDPERFEAAAARLESAAVALPESLPTREVEEAGFERGDPRYRELPPVDDDARAHASRTARAAAMVHWLRAGAEWARRQQAERARNAASHAEALGTEGKVFAIAVRLAVRDGEGALHAADTAIAAPDFAALSLHARVTTLAGRALALAMLDRPEPAYEAARRALELAATLPPEPMVGDVTREDVAWLVVATALRAGHAGEATSGLPELPADQATQPDTGAASGPEALARQAADAITRWRQVSTLRGDARRKALWSANAVYNVTAAGDPAVFYVLGAAAPPGSDVEAFLDVMSPAGSSYGLRGYMLARAEAARWRGDAAATDAWAARVRRVTDLERDAASATLATLGGF